MVDPFFGRFQMVLLAKIRKVIVLRKKVTIFRSQVNKGVGKSLQPVEQRKAMIQIGKLIKQQINQVTLTLL